MAFPELPDDRRARPRRYRGGDAPERTGRRRAPEDPPPPGSEGADEQDWFLGTALQHGVAVEDAGEQAEPGGRGVRTRHAPEPGADPDEGPRGRRYRNGFEELAGERSARHGNGNGYAEGRNGTGAHSRPENPDPQRARYADRVRDARPYEADPPQATGRRRAADPARAPEERTGGHRRPPGGPDTGTGGRRRAPEGTGAHRRGAPDPSAPDQAPQARGGAPDARSGFAGGDGPGRSRRSRADDPTAFDPPLHGNGRPPAAPAGFDGMPPERGPQAPPPDGPRARPPRAPHDTPGGFAGPPPARGPRPPDGPDGAPPYGRGPRDAPAGFDGGPPPARGPRAAPPGFDGARPPRGGPGGPDALAGPDGAPPHGRGPQAAPNGPAGPDGVPPQARGPRAAPDAPGAPPYPPGTPVPDGFAGPAPRRARGPQAGPGDGPPPARPPVPPRGPVPPGPGFPGHGAPADAGDPYQEPRPAEDADQDAHQDDGLPPETVAPQATTRAARRRAGALSAGGPPDTDEDRAAADALDDDAAADEAPGPRAGRRSGPVGVGGRIAAFAGLGKDEDGEKRKLAFWKELLLLAGVAILLTILIQTFLAKVYVIPSGSMETTLHGCTGCTNDRVLVDKVTYNFTDISPGDIVVFRGTDGWASETYTGEDSANPLVKGAQTLMSLVGIAPPDEKDFVKRVIAVGGQTVACCDALNQVMVDGQPLEEPYVYYLPEAGPARQIPFGPVTVPEGEYWMMGDSRNNSADSRAAGHGPIPEENIIGKVRLVVLPFDRFGWVSAVDPQTTANAAGAQGLPAGLPLALGMMGTLPLAVGRRRVLRARAEAERFLPATRRPPGWRRRS